MSDRVTNALLEQRGAIIQRLTELVGQPSVSTDSAYREGMAGARTLLVERLQLAGFEEVQTLEAGGHPAVYGQWCHAPGKPTFLVYGHYDVQPPDPLERWDSPPFQLTQRDDRLYGRGVSDDKGPMSIAVETLSAFLAVEGQLPVNIKLLIEGEEEVGSATLAAIFETHRDRLAADAVLSADGARWRADLPSVTVGCRGDVAMEFRVQSACKDLHSGRYGGAVANGLHVLAALLASLHTSEGGVAVADFFANVGDVDPAERARLATIPFDEQRFIDDLETAALGEPGYTTLERLWLRPTLEVNGVSGGYSGEGAKTVIPCEASAKLTARLVPGQTPAGVLAAVEAHLHRHCPDGVKLDFIPQHGGARAYQMPDDHPLLLASETVLTRVLGKEPLRVKMGSTLPMADLVASSLGIHTVMFSFSTADEDFHAPNEFFRLSALDQGLTAWVQLLRLLGEQKAEDYAGFR